MTENLVNRQPIAPPWGIIQLITRIRVARLVSKDSRKLVAYFLGGCSPILERHAPHGSGTGTWGPVVM
ncbi:hypothetical protein [Rhizobium binae]|uniref:hypothetical protein n=1 Tax=Rhizobium binae TaxID=1138190 RepID=UPI001C838C56|nr:hypothetical protein [Rhizobium binae]MBX4967845.1 hypothetical protein [Rhizobium binae]